MKSEFTIQYKDMIADQKRHVAYLMLKKERLIREGQTILYPIIRQIATAKRILALLQRSRQDPELDLWKVNEELNHPKK